MRALSQSFMDGLLNATGALHPILKRIKNDHTLMLSIRKGYVNVYYRGGNILRIRERNGSFSAFFDKKYNKAGQEVPVLPDTIKCQDEAKEWVDSFQYLKGIIKWTPCPDRFSRNLSYKNAPDILT